MCLKPLARLFCIMILKQRPDLEILHPFCAFTFILNRIGIDLKKKNIVSKRCIH